MALISSYLLPDEASASLVGLALQYTLLIPIYLNWVVKLLADLEMYFGACERISYYIENCYHEQQNLMGTCKYTIFRLSSSYNERRSYAQCFILNLFMFRRWGITRILATAIWQHWVPERFIEAPDTKWKFHRRFEFNHPSRSAGKFQFHFRVFSFHVQTIDGISFCSVETNKP